MKKNLIALAAALALASTGIMAQDESAGGASAGAGAATGVAAGVATGVAVAVVVAVAAAIVSNSDGVTLPITPPPPVETCEGTDPLVGGVCVGTTSTVTVTGTGTGTATGTTTVTVPVTFTYAPTVN